MEEKILEALEKNNRLMEAVLDELKMIKSSTLISGMWCATEIAWLKKGTLEKMKKIHYRDEI